MQALAIYINTALVHNMDMEKEFIPISFFLVDGNFLGDKEEDLDRLRFELYANSQVIIEQANIGVEFVALMALSKSIKEITSDNSVLDLGSSGVITSASQLKRGYKDHWYTVAQAGCFVPIIQQIAPHPGFGEVILSAKL